MTGGFLTRNYKDESEINGEEPEFDFDVVVPLFLKDCLK